jgi:hypothetical protein
VDRLDIRLDRRENEDAGDDKRHEQPCDALAKELLPGPPPQGKPRADAGQQEQDRQAE